MKIKLVMIFSLLLIILACSVYYYHFSVHLSYSISDKPNDWALFGNYLSGVLTPALSFISIVLLIYSLNLQKESNTELKSEIQRSVKLDKIKAFEVQFYNMLDSQRVAFKAFHLVFLENQQRVTKKTVDAVHSLEDLIKDYKDTGAPKAGIVNALKTLDEKEQIYTLVRIFFIITKTTINKLSDEEGFTEEDRIDYLETLINFTDFPQVRLILLSIKYQTYYGSKYLGTCKEFMEVISRLGLDKYLADV